MNLNEYCYVCYSLNLHNRLKENDIKYFKKGLDVSTNRYFWIYSKDNRTNKILKDWTDGVGK